MFFLKSSKLERHVLVASQNNLGLLQSNNSQISMKVYKKKINYFAFVNKTSFRFKNITRYKPSDKPLK